MIIKIVQATADNAHLLDTVAPNIFDESINPARVKFYFQDSNHLMVLALDGTLVVGQVRAILHRHPDLPTELYLDNLGVEPAYQRQGIATKLMEKITSLGTSLGAEEIWLGTEPGNAQANSFYKTRGLNSEQMTMFFNKL